VKLNSISQKKSKSTVVVNTTSNRARLRAGEVRHVELHIEFHGAGIIDKAVVRVAGAVVKEARHSVGDSLGGCRLAGGDVSDNGYDGAIDAPGVEGGGSLLGLVEFWLHQRLVVRTCLLLGDWLGAPYDGGVYTAGDAADGVGAMLKRLRILAIQPGMERDTARK
jgi:hypothetical protein